MLLSHSLPHPPNNNQTVKQVKSIDVTCSAFISLLSVVIGPQDSVAPPPHPTMLHPGLAPWLPHPSMMPMDPATAYHQQQAMMALFHNQFMFYQQQQQLMMGAYPATGVVPPTDVPVLDQFVDQTTVQQLAATSPNAAAVSYSGLQPAPPPPPEIGKHMAGGSPGGLFIPGVNPVEQQHSFHTQHNMTSFSQKPNQAIPIVSPEEK